MTQKKTSLASMLGQFSRRQSTRYRCPFLLITPLAMAVTSCATLPEPEIAVGDGDFTAYLFNEHCDATTIEDEPGCEMIYAKTGLTQIPLLPNQGCYRWSGDFGTSFRKGGEAIERWITPRENLYTTEAERQVDIQPSLSDDRFYPDNTPHKVDKDTRWLSTAWCVTNNTKTGPQAIEIEYRGKVLKRFDFTVVPPDAMEIEASDKEQDNAPDGKPVPENLNSDVTED